MLDLSTDAAGDVNLRVYGDSRLANLSVVVDPACINGGTRATYLAVEHLGKLEQLVEALLGTNAVASGNHDGRTFEVVLCSLDMMVEHLHYKRLGRHVLSHLGIDHLLAAVALVESLLHNAAAHRCHLRTMLGVNNRCHDVSTESRTYLVEKVVVGCLVFLVLIRANLKLCAVGSKTAGERRADARTEVAANDRGSHEAYLRLLLLEQADDDVGMGCRGVGEQPLAVEDKQLVDTVGQYLVFNLALDAGADDNSVELHTELIGKLATLGKKLLRYLLYRSTFYLNIYKYVLHISIL